MVLESKLIDFYKLVDIPGFAGSFGGVSLILSSIDLDNLKSEFRAELASMIKPELTPIINHYKNMPYFNDLEKQFPEYVTVLNSDPYVQLKDWNIPHIGLMFQQYEQTPPTEEDYDFFNDVIKETLVNSRTLFNSKSPIYPTYFEYKQKYRTSNRLSQS